MVYVAFHRIRECIHPQPDEADRLQTAELKDHFEDETNSNEYQRLEMELPEAEGPELLFGSNNYASKQDIIASVPARPIVDRLVSRYFNAMDMVPGKSFVWSCDGRILGRLTQTLVVIHGPTFLKEVSFLSMGSIFVSVPGILQKSDFR